MKIGISGTDRGEKGSADYLIGTAQLAEELGYDFVSKGDSQNLSRDVYSSLGLAGYHTDSIEMGPLVTNPITRHPVVTASAICTLNEVTGGRAFLGVATGDSSVFTIGETPARLNEMEEFVHLIKEITTGGTYVYEGNEIQLHWVTEENQPREIPVRWAAEGPKTQKLAGKLADGVLLGGGVLPEIIELQVANVMAGVKEAGRDPDEIEIWVVARSNVADDRDAAIEDIKPALAGMANHSLRFTMEDKAVPDEHKGKLQELKDRYDSQHHGSPGKSPNVELIEDLELTEFLVDRYGIIGTPTDCIEKFEAIQTVDAVDGVYLSTPLDRSRAAMEKMATDVIDEL